MSAVRVGCLTFGILANVGAVSGPEFSWGLAFIGALCLTVHDIASRRREQ